MNNKLIRKITVPVSQSDSTGRMSIPGIFAFLMDMASDHACQINMGMDALAKEGVIWLAVKTKLKIHSRPETFTDIIATTWPAQPGRIRCDRLYKVEQDGQLIIEAKNEWAIFQPATAKLMKLETIYPKELVHHEEIVCEQPYAKLKEDFGDCETMATYTVKSTDLDTSQHMNNVQYIRAVFGAFTSAQLADMDIDCVDISYKNQCYEGELLTLKKKNVENGFEIGIIRENGTAGAIVRITLK